MKKHCFQVRKCKSIRNCALKYVKLRSYDISLIAVWDEIENSLLLEVNMHEVKCLEFKKTLQSMHLTKVA